MCEREGEKGEHKVSCAACAVAREVKAAEEDRKCLELKEKGSTHKDFDTE